MQGPNFKRRGVTLIELIIVMLIITFGLVGLAATFSVSSTSLASNEVLQQASQHAQACAERVLGARRNDGFTQFLANGPFSCGLDPAGFTRLPNDGSPDTGPTTVGDGTGACPSGITCRTITITVTSKSNTSLSSIVTVMLAQ